MSRRGGRRLQRPPWAWAGALALSLLLGGGRGAERYIEDTDRFPGWKGELPLLAAAQEANATLGALGAQEPTGISIGFGENGKVLWRGEVVEISWRPRAFLFKNFLSDAECDHLIKMAKPSMTKSTVVDNDTGKSVDSTVRTSTGTFFEREHDEIVARIERRIAMISHVPEQNGEGLQILHYVNGQKYEPHHDFFHDKYNSRPENGGQRIATVLMYLTTPEEGGETVFPQADKKVSGPGWSDCARQGLAVKTRRGSALLFYSLTPSGEVDYSSLHGSCPTTKGEKWSATKWLHVGQFGGTQQNALAKWGACVDADERCPAWALDNQCKINPSYMMTSCRKSCTRCTSPDKAA